MNTKYSSPSVLLDLFTVAAVWAAIGLAGCVKQQAYQPVSTTQPATPGPAVAEDDYVYYPEYEVYYSNHRHLYGYWESGAWYWRPAPPRVGVNVLSSSPSVRLDFHDSPERHHATVIKRYPHDWRPSAPPHDNQEKAKDPHHPDEPRH